MTDEREEREVSWRGAGNARDLGGLPLEDGGATRIKRVFRSGKLDELDEEGWAELAAAGVRTIVDLRNDNEIVELPLRPVELTATVSPLEQINDPFFATWTGKHGQMDYFRASIDHWPSLYIAAFSAIAEAPSGGVVIHCAAGRDRTGAICALLLDAAGVERDAVLEDYELGIRATNAILAETPAPHERPLPPEELEVVVVRARERMNDFLDSVLPQPVRVAMRRAAKRLL